tara:strand:- start:322 stop:774 length:453 start_codon:yes stop_codon:yes gene_type:complete
MNKQDLCKSIQHNSVKLAQNELLELFKLIKNCNVNYTQNNNGIFLNLNWLSKENLIKINNYISFCIKSQNEISKYETIKKLLNNSIETSQIDEKIEKNKVITNDNITNTTKQKFSSSMKFYLLKKKFSKQNTLVYNVYDNELKYEDYLIT